MHEVKATREGLIGGKTSSGYIVDNVTPYVALPSRRAIGKIVRVTNSLNNLSTLAVVLDVGPWNGGVVKGMSVDDDLYVFGTNRPQAESGMDWRGRKTNKAGIDLGERVWNALDMKDNTNVVWEFYTGLLS